MPRYILKCDPDIDYYVDWSTVVDNICYSGNRQFFLSRGEPEDRLERADKTGTSCIPDEFGSCCPWEDEYLIVNNCRTVSGFRLLPRRNLFEYAQRYANDDIAGAESLTIEDLNVD